MHILLYLSFRYCVGLVSTNYIVITWHVFKHFNFLWLFYVHTIEQSRFTTYIGGKNNDRGYLLITGKISKSTLWLEFQGDFVHQVTQLLLKTVLSVLSEFLNSVITLYSEIMEKYQISPYQKTLLPTETAVYHLNAVVT